MKKFLIISFLLIITWVISFFILSLFVDGSDDVFYLRFTTPKQSSLIIGASRAAQGIMPGIINPMLNNVKLYNYSFANYTSPFGKIYFESIKKKLDSKIKNGFFIISVTPFSISSLLEDPNDSSQFRENKRALDNKFVNHKPNIHYLYRFFNHKYHKILGEDDNLFLHPDGWLEVKVPMDSINVNSRTNKKINIYKNMAYKYNFSKIRLEYLSKIIKYLEGQGNVYLVRLPVHPEMKKIEDKVIPSFEELIDSLAFANDVSYLSISDSNHNYLYTDGNHLYSEDAKKVSSKIANWIRTENVNQKFP